MHDLKALSSVFQKRLLLTSVLLTVLVVNLAELALIERKFGFFFGGFLQAHPLTTTWERFAFLSLSLWIDFVFFGALAVCWNLALSPFRIRALLSAYHYFVVTSSLCLALTVVKYQLLAYFSDTINFTVLSHMAGGSLSTMFSFVEGQGQLITFITAAWLVLYLTGLLVARRLAPCPQPSLARLGFPSCPTARTLAATGLLTGLALTVVHYCPSLRLGLKEKLS
jgi:hypothetical protein